MPETRTCPNCGSALPARSPEGLCPRCVFSAGIGNSSDLPGTTSTRGLGPPLRGVFETIAATTGSVPHILLRDTDGGTEPPLHRPNGGGETDFGTRYRIDGEIARGGMGSVLKGRDPDLGRDVALKVLRDDFRDNLEMVRRFVEEAQIGGQLQHPGIVPIYEMGVFRDHRPFFAMKLVKGDTFAKLLDGRRNPADGLPRHIGIFEAIAQTIAYSHARGVIHRDLKPSNVMVGSFGEVQVMDWGLAKILSRGGVADDASAGKPDRQETVIATARSGSDNAELSHAGSVLGTPSYMAPEQARGEIDQIDERADVFALGSILCEILTGQPAFVGRGSGEIQHKSALGDLADAFSRLDASGADADLVGMAKDCLSREPADRPRDAGVVSGRVKAYLTGVQEKLRRAELQSVEERARRRVTTVAAASLVLLSLIGGGGFVWNQQQKSERVAKTARAVDDALADAARLRGEAQAAPAGEMEKWAEAFAAVKRAEGLLAQGEADDPLRRRVTAQLAQLDRERSAAAEKARLAESDRLLLERLEAVRAHRIDERDSKSLHKKFAAAFADFRFDLEKMEPVEAAAALGGRAASVEIAAAIDVWADAQRDAHLDTETWQHLLAVAEAVDPDPFRNKLRSIVLKPDPDELRRLAADAIKHPDLPAATFVRLAHSLPSGGREQVDVLRAGRRRHPADFAVNEQLALACYALKNKQKGDIEDALRFATGAVALRPRSPGAHYVLGAVLYKKARIYLDGTELDQADGAIDEFREAIRLDPDLANAHSFLGFALDGVGGRAAEAVAAWKEAVKLDPSMGSEWRQMGESLIELGDFEAAVDALRHAQLLVGSGGFTGGSQPNLDPSLELARAERYVILKRRLPGVLRGDDKPSPAERIEFARVCFNSSLYATAARFAKQAYTEAPELLENATVGRRYYLGVLSAARAGCGEGKDDPAPTEAERAQLRDQARLWFQDEMVKWKRQFAAGPMSAKLHVRDLFEVARKKTVSLRGFIDPARVAKLPEAEQAAWRAIWAEVDALLAEWQSLGRDMQGAIEAELERRLPAMLRNEDRPTTQADRRRVAEICYRRKLYVASVRFYDDFLKNDVVLNDRPASSDRYNAACSAALAGCGRGEDEPSPSDDEKARLRGRALAWMKVELEARKRALATGLAKSPPVFIKELQHLQDDADFAGVRGAESLAKLAANEQQMWRVFWEEVAAVLEAALSDRP